MGKTFTMAWRNMWRNWRRTTIALVAIVLGLILLIFFDGMITGSDQAIFGNAVKIYVRPQRLAFGVHIKDGTPSLHVGAIHGHAPVKTAGAQ